MSTRIGIIWTNLAATRCEKMSGEGVIRIKYSGSSLSRDLRGEGIYRERLNGREHELDGFSSEQRPC